MSGETPVDETQAQPGDLDYNLPKNTRVGNAEDIRALAELALQPGNINQRIRYAMVDQTEAATLREVTGLKLEGYRHTVDFSGIRHTFRKHGEDRTELPRGQLAVNVDDIARIPDIVSSPDEIRSRGKDEMGNELIEYQKRVNGTTYYVEEVRTGRKELVIKTLWKTRTTLRAASEEGVAVTSETISRNQPELEDTLPQEPEPTVGTENEQLGGKFPPKSVKKPKTPKPTTDYGKDNKLVSQDRAAELRAKLKAKLNQLSAGIDPELLAMGTELAVFHIEAGTRKFAAFAKTMADDLGVSLEKIRPYLRSWYNGARDMIEDAGMSIEGMDNPDQVRQALDNLNNPIVATYPGEENTEARVIKNDAGYIVQVFDRDAGEALPSMRQFKGDNALDKARAYAQSLAGKQETQQSPITSDIRKALTDIANFVSEWINYDRTIDWRQLVEEANRLIGGTQAEGAWNPKEVYDAMELGFNLWVVNQDFSAMSPVEAVALMKRKQALLPTQTRRDAKTDTLQQFSTPHAHSHVAAWVAHIGANDRVLEPSAGTGNLVAHALVYQPEQVIGNELDERRADLMGELGVRVERENATLLNAVLPKDIHPTVVVMNPPFSADVNKPGAKDLLLGAKHIEQALKRLEPGGRLVAILGRGMALGRNRTKPWWDRIGHTYQVRANITVSGDEYRKLGTTFDNVIVVIDKNGNTTQWNEVVRGEVDKVEQLIPLLEGIRNDRVAAGKQPTDQPSGETRPVKIEDKPAGRPTVQPAVDEGSVQAPAQPGSGTTSSGGGGFRRPTTGGRPGKRDGLLQGEDGKPVAPAGPETPGSGELAADIRSERDTGTTPGSRAPGVNPASRPKKSEVRPQKSRNTDSVFEDYAPLAVIEGAQAHPSPLAESAAMASMVSPPIDYTPDLPQDIVSTGKLSAAQIETIARAGDAHTKTLPDGSRRGFFDGDGTGVGKGAQIAGIILDNWRQGRKKAIWLSKNRSLYTDAIRDLEWVGMDKAEAFELAANKMGDEIKRGSGVIFSTYDTVGRGIKKSNDDGTARIEQIVKWVGEDFDGVLAFDESHLMGNALDSAGSRGMKKASDRALAGIALQRRLPQARVVYFSATGATEVTNLAYLDRLGLWGEGTAFADKQQFISQVTAGGVAAMEVVAKDLKAMGSYVSRSLSFDGVTYDTLVHKISDDQREIYDTLARAWQITLTNIHQALIETGVVSEGQANGRARGQELSKFWGAHQRFFNAVLTGMQMPTVLKEIEKNLASDQSAVLQVVNTNEATQERRAAQAAENDIPLEEMDVSPRDILMQYIEMSFPVQQYEEYIDDDGNIRSRPVVDSQGRPVENPEAVARRDQLLDELGAIPVPDSALDQLINHFGTQQVAEITGRKRRFVRQADGSVEEEKRGKRATDADVQAFNAGRKRILIFSDAGGTGKSYHASRDFENQQKRIHYLLQPGWRADSAIQGTGRTHRTNQAIAPHYNLVTTDLKAQLRFIATIARRLDQLGALTKGQRDTASQGMFSAEMNLENHYGEMAAERLVADIMNGSIPDIALDEFQAQTGIVLVDEQGRPVERDITVKLLMNRMLSLTTDMMDRVFNGFMQRFMAQVEYAKEQGTFDTGMETIVADKVMVEEDTEIPGTQSRYVKLALENPAERIAYDDLTTFKDLKFVRNRRSKKLYAVYPAMSVTDTETGRVVKRMRRLSPRGGDYILETEIATKYDKVSPNETVRVEWDKGFDEAPQTKTTHRHLIGGVLLPIWDRLPHGTAKIFRAFPDNADVVLGREINAKELGGTLKALGVSVDVPQRTPSEWLQRVLTHGDELVLANGWKIAKRTVSGEARVEILGPQFGDFELLTGMGAFTERHNYKTRIFLPSDNADILERVFKHKPIIEVVNLGRNESSAEFSRRIDKAPHSAPVFEHEAVERIGQRIARKVLIRAGLSVVASEAQLPAAVQEEAERQGATGQIRGVLYKGKVHIVASAIQSEAEIEELILHEGWGHYGVRKLFGKRLNNALSSLYLKLGGYKGIQRLAEQHGFADKMGPYFETAKGLPAAQREFLLMDEFLAHAQGKRAYESLPAKVKRALQEFWGALRSWLRSKGMANLAAFTDSDLAYLLRRMAKAAQQDGQVRSKQPVFIRAWHGSPHAFDEFTTDAIGSGEGFQKYGWGLYFSSRKSVAKWYREKMSTREDTYQGVPLSKTGLGAQAIEALEDVSRNIFDDDYDFAESVEGTIADLRERSLGPPDPAQGFAEAITVLEGLSESDLGRVFEGHLYQVDLAPSEDEYLLWDTPLGKQSDKVQAAARKLHDSVYDEPIDRMMGLDGASFYQDLSDVLGSQEAASSALKRAGIRGVKYLDGASRQQGKGAHNYVVFDASDIAIKAAFSRAPDEITDDTSIAERHAAMSKNAGKGMPIDRLFRLPFNVVGKVNAKGEWTAPASWRKVGGAVADHLESGAQALTRQFPAVGEIVETAKAGLISQYGLSDAYIDRGYAMEAEERRMAMQASDIIEDLAKRGVDSVEAKVLQSVLTGETVGNTDMQAIAEPIRRAIDELGEMAVDANLITREQFEENRATYLHRVYRKHEDNQTDLGRWIGTKVSSRRKKIVGNQLKGRGIFWEVGHQRLIQDVPPDWMGSKQRAGRADLTLKGKEFYVFDKLSATGEGTANLPGIEGNKPKGKVTQRVYWPADVAVPARFEAWESRGKFKVRDVQGGKLTLWRDYTKAERVKMGEILDARYTIAKTFQLMSHDIATARFYKDIATNEDWTWHDEGAPENARNAKELGYRTYADVDWVKVPDSTISKTGGKKRWGALAGKYVRAEIWRDLNELDRMNRSGTWQTILTQWKLNKTARNPVVHMNNIMSNLLFMDMADIRLRDLVAGLESLVRKDADYRDAMEHGAFGSSFIHQEINKNILEPILAEIKAQNQDDKGFFERKVGNLGRYMDIFANGLQKADKQMVNLYQLEDEWFRMATYLRRRSLGDAPELAARTARDQFLNYDIRAPWVNLARRTALPFIAYTYRAIPVIAQSLIKRPWKIAKYMTVAYALNALAYALSEGDEDEERRSLDPKLQGNTWVGVPRMLRAPWNSDGNPVFLDIRRWIPAGDVFDMNQGSSAAPIPAWLQFGGPLMLGAEFALNKTAFTGKEITNDLTDDWQDKLAKNADWAYKSWMPSAFWIPNSWYWEKMSRSGAFPWAEQGRDRQGRLYSPGQAFLSSVGIKLSPHDVMLGYAYQVKDLQEQQRAQKWELRKNATDLDRGLISEREYRAEEADIRGELEDLGERMRELRGE